MIDTSFLLLFTTGRWDEKGQLIEAHAFGKSAITY